MALLRSIAQHASDQIVREGFISGPAKVAHASLDASNYGKPGRHGIMNQIHDKV